MTWYWYVSRPDELMLDIDGGPGGSKLGPCRLRLEAAIRSGKLNVCSDMYLYRSGQPGHYHVIVPLKASMSAARRFVWEMQLRSDLYRGRCNLMRAEASTPAPGLLISPRAWHGFYRDRDAVCDCPRKHDFRTFSKCPAAQELRGNAAAGESYFGELRKLRMVPKLKIMEGRIDTDIFAYSEAAWEFDNGQRLPVS